MGASCNTFENFICTKWTRMSPTLTYIFNSLHVPFSSSSLSSLLSSLSSYLPGHKNFLSYGHPALGFVTSYANLDVVKTTIINALQRLHSNDPRLSMISPVVSVCLPACLLPTVSDKRGYTVSYLYP